MVKTKEIFGNGFYIFQSRVAANSNYIENISEAKQLLIYARFYLRGYLKVHDFVITKDGWQMAVKLHGAEEILKREGLSAEDSAAEIWRIISERVRLFISTYVKCVNHLRGRTGVLVHSSYIRYYFENLKDAMKHLDTMRDQLVRMYQRKKKYRGKKSHYKIPEKLGKGSIFLCSKELRRDEVERDSILDCQFFLGSAEVVVEETIKYTTINHLNLKAPPLIT